MPTTLRMTFIDSIEKPAATYSTTADATAAAKADAHGLTASARALNTALKTRNPTVPLEAIVAIAAFSPPNTPVLEKILLPVYQGTHAEQIRVSSDPTKEPTCINVTHTNIASITQALTDAAATVNFMKSEVSETKPLTADSVSDAVLKNIGQKLKSISTDCQKSSLEV